MAYQVNTSKKKHLGIQFFDAWYESISQTEEVLAGDPSKDELRSALEYQISQLRLLRQSHRDREDQE